MSHKLPPLDYLPVGWAPWFIPPARENPTGQAVRSSWEGIHTLRAPLTQKALGTRTAWPGRPAEGMRPTAPRKAEWRGRNDHAEMTPAFILHPTHCQKEELCAHCLRRKGEGIAGGPLQGPNSCWGEKGGSQPHLSQSLIKSDLPP